MLRLVVLLIMLAVPSGSDTRLAANTFATAYNRWVATLQPASPHVVNAREILAWKEVKEQWKTLDRLVKYTE